ncbi:MAG: hypothetical protein M3P18_07580, partial [Actinomycetota bacterium]|nr:hypothetical protein [Actinomycetota bacterium]
VMGQARAGITGLARLTAQVGELAEVLADDAEHSRQLRMALSEVGSTYQVVETALERFMAAGVDPLRMRGEAFARLERGVLKQAITNGRGHCGRIATHYKKIGGVRDAVKDAIRPEMLQNMDATFERLGSADGDLFAAMDALGEALTGESQIIVRFLSTGRESAARTRIAAAREQLLPLEDELTEALADFQSIEALLGYAEPTSQGRGVISMSIRTINIGGDVINSNVVAAETIENSSLTVASAPISSELKATLLDLHKAVGALTADLPDDEAERTAQDLKELAEEAKKPSPRPAFWKRAAEGLMAAAKLATEVGLPVIALVTKVIELL